MEKKYHNHAQLVQGVSQVNDSTLSQGERCFLNCLAAYSVKTYPHPGNEKLRIACGLKTRQGVNYIASKLIGRRLVEIIGHGRGGHGMAAVYRICTDDPRFPFPKPATVDKEPASSDLQVSGSQPESSDLRVNDDEPASEQAVTRKYDHNNPQVVVRQPASSDLHPDLDSGFRLRIHPEGAATAALDDDDDFIEPTDQELLNQYVDRRKRLRAEVFAQCDAAFKIGHLDLWKQANPQDNPTALRTENQKANQPPASDRRHGVR
jgi:hypothetical protein